MMIIKHQKIFKKSLFSGIANMHCNGFVSIVCLTVALTALKLKTYFLTKKDLPMKQVINLTSTLREKICAIIETIWNIGTSITAAVVFGKKM